MQIHTAIVNSTTQLIRQLEAIECSINTALRQLQANCVVAHSEKYRALQTSRSDISIHLDSSDQCNASTPSMLTVSPVFPGSYSQSDVAIQSIAISESGIDARSAAQTFHPLHPALFFAQFNALPEKLRIKPAGDGLSLIIILPELSVSTTNPDRYNRESLERFDTLFSKARQIKLISMGAAKTRRQRTKSILAKCSQLALFEKKHAQIDVHALAHEEVPLLFSLIGVSDYAIVPDIGTAIDVLNAGCGCTIWMPEHDVPECLRANVASMETGTAAVRDRKAQAVEQREKLVQWSRQQLQYVIVTHSIHELTNAMVLSTANPVFQSLRAGSEQRMTTDIFMQKDVIPTKFITIKPARTQIIEVMAGLHRKIRKLRQSPRQFLSDSRHPLLRSMANISSQSRT